MFWGLDFDDAGGVGRRGWGFGWGCSRGIGRIAAMMMGFPIPRVSMEEVPGGEDAHCGGPRDNISERRET